MEKISFVILTWNSEDVILPCLKSIISMKDQEYEIIVVDNGSSDHTVDKINSFIDENPICDLSLILLEKNMGTTISRNIGIKKASLDTVYICILDSDTIINQAAMKELIEVLEENPLNAVTGPNMVNLENEELVTAKKIPTALLKIEKAIPIRFIQKKGEEQEKYYFVEEKRSYPVGYLISACWMLKKAMIEKIGLLDENIFYSPEDVEYCVRIWKKGYRVVYCPEAHIIHATQRISKKKIFSRHNWEHLKGLVYFFGKYKLFRSSNKIDCK